MVIRQQIQLLNRIASGHIFPTICERFRMAAILDDVGNYTTDNSDPLDVK